VDESQLQKREQPAPARQSAELRASDADRDRAAGILREALAEGRLTAEEHSERLDTVYAAKKVGELEPVVRDLPGGYTAAVHSAAGQGYEYGPGVSGENPTLIGILGGGERRGRWRVGNRINAVAIMGGVVIDLTEATFTSPEVVINCSAIMGGVEIRVPENVTLRGGVVGIMGGADIRTNDSGEPNAPVVRVRGLALMGGVDAKPKRGKRLKEKGRGELDW
jgi:hypothetical protein